jgi:DNA repair exonuclease SbcCD nuclease subunit
MARFTFLHAADLHLGSPLTGLAMKDETVARRFAAASREAFSELVTQAIAEKVAFVVVAGDIYDGDWKDTSIGLFFNREVSRLARIGIPLFLIRGNHDAESEITKAVTLPENVFEFPSRKAETHRLDAFNVAIHGRSFADRAATENYAIAYPPPVAGWFNVGMLHTSCEGNAAHAVYAPCTVAELAGRGYDYWALGHIHEQAVLHRDPWIVYSGNLQGRSVRECGPKGAILVDVADVRVTGLRPRVVVRARWLHVTVPVADIPDEAGLLQAVREALQAPLSETTGRMTALRVTLTGRTSLHDRLRARRNELRDEVQALANHVHDDAWLEALKFATMDPAVTLTVVPGVGGVDPAALLVGLEHDGDVRLRAAELIALVRAKLPGGVGEGALDDLDAILAEARSVASARALGGAA